MGKRINYSGCSGKEQAIALAWGALKITGSAALLITTIRQTHCIKQAAGTVATGTLFYTIPFYQPKQDPNKTPNSTILHQNTQRQQHPGTPQRYL